MSLKHKHRSLYEWSGQFLSLLERLTYCFGKCTSQWTKRGWRKLGLKTVSEHKWTTAKEKKVIMTGFSEHKLPNGVLSLG